VFVSIFDAGGHQESSFVRDKRINADVMWCLQSVSTFHVPNRRRHCKAGSAVGSDLVGHRCTAEALHWRTQSVYRGRYWLVLKWNEAHPLAESKGR
jgi:hypothetical protein